MSQQKFQKLLARYDYKLQLDRIATSPATPRDSARLMVYDRHTGRTFDVAFRDLPQFLPKGALLVFNDTKVIPARLTLTKPTGGRVRVLFVDLEGKPFGNTRGSGLRVLADRAMHNGDVLRFRKEPVFRVLGRDGKYVVLAPLFRGSVKQFLEWHGEAPLPPYIKNTPLSPREQRERYQTVFAKIPGSIAAPTASLHFTPRLLRALKKAGIETTFITLHVGLGTFAPLTPENIHTESLHGEEYSVSAAAARTIKSALREKRPIIPVGTTALRTLESVFGKDGRARKLHGKSALFIRDGYRFRIANGLITNFHVPRSSLLMLVSAFAGRENTLKLYRRAIKTDYRFFSFGDGMLIL